MDLFKFDFGKYDKFLYGLLAGVVLGVIIAAFQILTVLVLVNVFLSCLIVLRLWEKPKLKISLPSLPKSNKPKEKAKSGVCPTCGRRKPGVKPGRKKA